MTKEKIKTFVKDHKREIIIVATAIAGTACAIIGIKKIKICRNQIKSCEEEIKRLNQFNKSLREATSGCSKYVPVRYPDSKTFSSFKDLSLWLADKFREADMFVDDNFEIIDIEKMKK